MLNGIKSKIILKQVFICCQGNIFLKLILYNKKLQNKIDISIIDAITSYNTIIFEIIPISNPTNNPIHSRYKFINIHPDDSSHYRIYFDNNNEEIHRTYLTSNDAVSKIIVLLDRKVKSFKGLFKDCKYINEVKIISCLRRNIYNTSEMFYACTSLTKVDLSNLKTENVYDMSWMFYFCSALEELDISNFQTSNVTNLEYMFSLSKALKCLNLSNFDTSNVNNMESMFSYCQSLKDLNIRNLNISKVKNMKYMFEGCKSLNNLSISDFCIMDTTVTTHMFSNCRMEAKNTVYSLNKHLKSDSFRSLKL